MLELDLDMEADLGIDTVKQAELFAAIREHFNLPRKENLSLKDYPTIRHCINYVMSEKGMQVQGSKPQTADVTSQKTKQIEPGIPKIPKSHFRYAVKIVQAKVEKEVINKFSSKNPVAILCDDMSLAKNLRSELSRLNIKSHLFTSKKGKLPPDATHVNWKNTEEISTIFSEMGKKHQFKGIFYLLGIENKSPGISTNAFEDLKKYALPLFISLKHFAPSLSKPEEGCRTFLASVTAVDGAFGYKTKNAFNPISGAINGITLCARKELEDSRVKLIDFDPKANAKYIVQKTLYEIQFSDEKTTICYDNGRRSTLVAAAETLDTSSGKLNLKGKRIIITGGGRGLGALFARMLADSYSPEIIILDVISYGSESEKWAHMNEEELNKLKNELWKKMKTSNPKTTPVMLEREFSKIKDSATLHKTLEKLREAGAKAEYHFCDLNDKENFDRVLGLIKNKYGKIDGVVHFAGIERSKLMTEKELKEFTLVFNTKATSVMNFLNAAIVKEKGFFVMISSIAGKFGNLGQSDYAAASDYISKLAHSLKNKGYRAVAIDMTGYANIGMATRPGVQAFLQSQGVEFLYPEEGMRAVLNELTYGDVCEILLTRSLGKLDLDKQLKYDPNFAGNSSRSSFHFLEQVREEEMEASKEFSLKKDPYLADHSINLVPYVPGVMGIETFAETVACFLKENPRFLKNIKFSLPIKLHKNRPLKVQIKAENKGGILHMKIKSDFITAKGIKLGETRTHFTAEYGGKTHSKFSQTAMPDIPKNFRYKVTKDEIYKTYFHGPSFQVLDGIINVERKYVLGVYKKPKAPLWENKNENLIFFPMIIEAAFQNSAYRDIRFSQTLSLPDAAGEITLHSTNPSETLFVYSLYKGEKEGRSIYDIFVFDSAGKPVVEIMGYAGIPTRI